MSSNYPQSFTLTRLYRKKSEKSGATYFSGRLANSRLVLLKSKDSTDDGAEIWNLMISEAPKRDNEAGQRQEPPRAEPERQQVVRSSWQGRWTTRSRLLRSGGDDQAGVERHSASVLVRNYLPITQLRLLDGTG